MTDTFRERIDRELEEIRKPPRPWHVATVDLGDYIAIPMVVDARGREVPPQIIMAELEACRRLEEAARPLSTFDDDPHDPRMRLADYERLTAMLRLALAALDRARGQ